MTTTKIADTNDEFIATHRPAPDDLLVRVAALAGWQNVAKSTLSDHYFGTKDGDSRGYPIPLYTTNLDTIWGIYEEFRLYPNINRSADGNCHVSAFHHRSISTQILSADDPNLAIALCKLLVKISEKIE
jgi:hypothetical protein